MSKDKQNLTAAFKRGLIFKFNFVGRIILDDYDCMAVQSWAWAGVTAVKQTLVRAPLFEPKASLKGWSGTSSERTLMQLVEIGVKEKQTNCLCENVFILYIFIYSV